MRKKWEIDRRTFIRGLGASIALPMLDIMLPSIGNAANGKVQKLVYIYLPYGIAVDAGDTNPPAYLVNAMSAIKSDASFITGLQNANISEINGASHYIYWNPMFGGAATGSDSTECTTAGQLKSFDQYIAPLNVGSKVETLSLNAVQDTSPYNYVGIMANNISWKGPDKYVPSYVKPLDVYNQLFASNVPVQQVDQRMADQLKMKRGMLHYCMDDIKKIRNIASTSDKIRLDEYFDGINSLDLRLAATTAPVTTNTCQAPTGIAASDPNQNYPAHLKMFYDLMFVALKCDMTRNINLMHCAEGGSLRHKSFIPTLQYDNDWHVFSHFGQPGYSEGSNGSLSNDPAANQRDYEKLLIWHYTRIVEFVQRLKAEQTPTGNLLDETLVTWGSCLGRSSDVHDRENLFYTVAGGGGGAFNRGLTVINKNTVPITNLWLTIMNGFGANMTKFGKGTLASTGEISGLRKA